MSRSTATIEIECANRRLAAARMWASNSTKTRMAAETALVAAKSTFEAAKQDEREASNEVLEAERNMKEVEKKWDGDRKKKRAGDLDEDVLIAATTPRANAATNEMNSIPNVSTHNFTSTTASTGIKYPFPKERKRNTDEESATKKRRREIVDGGKSLVSFLTTLSTEKLINQQHISQSTIPTGFCEQNNRSYIRYALELVEFVIASSDELTVDFINLASDVNSEEAVATAAERVADATSKKLEQLDGKKPCLTLMGIGGRVRRYKKRIVEALGKISPETEVTMRSVEIIGLEELVELEGAVVKQGDAEAADKSLPKDTEMDDITDKSEPKEDVHDVDAEAGEQAPSKDTEMEDSSEKREPKEDVSKETEDSSTKGEPKEYVQTPSKKTRP